MRFEDFVNRVNEDVKKEEPLELGIKHDQDKLDWLQMPWCQLEKVIRCTNHGGRKYSPFNWMHVEKDRYLKATIRHLVAHLKGEKYDDESGEEHLAHMVASALFYMWHEENDERVD